jgi:hypothetical protein
MQAEQCIDPFGMDIDGAQWLSARVLIGKSGGGPSPGELDRELCRSRYTQPVQVGINATSEPS